MVPMARIATLAFGLCCLSGLAAADGTESRYEIFQGKISGFAQGDPPPVTILVDKITGQTWMLAVLGSSPQWLAIPFNAKPPIGTLPPPPR